MTEYLLKLRREDEEIKLHYFLETLDGKFGSRKGPSSPEGEAILEKARGLIMKLNIEEIEIKAKVKNK